LKRILASLAEESVLLLGLIAAACTALGVGEAVKGVALAAVPLLLAVLVRSITSSPSTVAGIAIEAAVKTAEQLSEGTVGAAGQLTGDAGNLVAAVAADVLSTVGGLASVVAPVTLEKKP
jgi:hypothetical protein